MQISDCQGLGGGENVEQLCNGYRPSFWGDGNLPERERVVVQYYECTKCFPLKRLTLYYVNLTSFKNKKRAVRALGDQLSTWSLPRLCLCSLELKTQKLQSRRPNFIWGFPSLLIPQPLAPFLLLKHTTPILASRPLYRYLFCLAISPI